MDCFPTQKDALLGFDNDLDKIRMREITVYITSLFRGHYSKANWLSLRYTAIHGQKLAWAKADHRADTHKVPDINTNFK